MSNGQGDAIHNFCSGDTGVFTLTEGAAGRNYGLGPLPPATESLPTVAENLESARAAVDDHGPYGAHWQAAVLAAHRAGARRWAVSTPTHGIQGYRGPRKRAS
jgi:hypothetical protein